MSSRNRFSRTWLLISGLFLLAPLAPIAQAQQAGKAKYVFLMIGDGMGPAQRTAAEIYLAGPQEPNKPVRLAKLTMNTLPFVGLARTNSIDSLVTDSAAAATAMATGRKVTNGTLSLEPDSNRALTTLAEIVKARGRKVGIVSSSSIDDATPAAFYAHQASRGSSYDISLELAASGMDYFAGAAASGIRPLALEGRPSPLEAARKNGYTLVSNRAQFDALKPGAGKVWHYWTKVDANGVVHFAGEPTQDQPSLAELTRKGIEILDGPAGFFMMIEGGKIDGGGHVHDLATTVRETLLFDQAVAVALEFYKKHPGETLIIVTNDHETGGMGVGGSGGGSLSSLHKRVTAQKDSYWEFAWTVGEFRAKKMAFEQAWPAVQEFFGFEEVAPSNLRLLQDAYALSMIDPNDRPKTAAYAALYAKLDPLAAACCNLLSRQAGVAWTTYSHTDMPAPVMAIGAGAELFMGYYENTDLFDKIRAAMTPAAAAK